MSLRVDGRDTIVSTPPFLAGEVIFTKKVCGVGKMRNGGGGGCVRKEDIEEYQQNDM